MTSHHGRHAQVVPAAAGEVGGRQQRREAHGAVTRQDAHASQPQHYAREEGTAVRMALAKRAFLTPIDHNSVVSSERFKDQDPDADQARPLQGCQGS